MHLGFLYHMACVVLTQPMVDAYLGKAQIAGTGDAYLGKAQIAALWGCVFGQSPNSIPPKNIEKLTLYLRDTVFFNNIIHILVTAARQIDQDGSRTERTRHLNGIGDGMAAFKRRNNSLLA